MAYPTLNTINQYGEQNNSTIVGGSVDVYCSFQIDVADSDGYGIVDLEGVGVAEILAHTSAATPAGDVNPAVGTMLIRFSDPYLSFLGMSASQQASTSTTVAVTSGLTLNAAYVITVVGTTTASAWHVLGLPAGVEPAVGAGFIAATASASTGTGEVQSAVATDGSNFVLIGDPNQTCNDEDGATLVLANYEESALAALPDGAVVRLKFSFTPVAAE